MKKEVYKKIMQKIKISKVKKEEIFSKIMEEKLEKKRHLKLVFITTCLLVFLILGSLGLVYAEEIKNTFNTIKIFHSSSKETIITSNVIVEINYEADIPEAQPILAEERQNGKKNNEYTFQELEDLLEIKLLKSEYYKKEKLEQYFTEKVDNKISRASFDLENFTNAKEIKKGKIEDLEDRYTMSFSLTTKYASTDIKENSKEVWSGYREDTYYIQALDTSAYIFKRNIENTILDDWSVRFDYENIHYTFWLHMYNKEEKEKTETMVKILESLHL